MEILSLKAFTLFQILRKNRQWLHQEAFKFVYKNAKCAVSFATLESPKPYQVSFKCLYHRPGLEINHICVDCCRLDIVGHLSMLSWYGL